MERVYTPTEDYKVLVNCMTYNQSKYIEDALNGFAMQKTDFPFVCLVMDDASTDGEQEVIKAWMERECDMEKAENVEIEKSFITLVPHKTNSNCTFAFYFLKKNLYGTGEKTPLITPWREHCVYEALCEGDDYWIDKKKLQKQCSYMQQHSECSLLHTAFYFYIQDEEKFYDSSIDQDIYVRAKNENRNVACEIFTFNYRVVTASSFFRASDYLFLQNWSEYNNHKYLLGDIQLWTMLLQRGEIGYIPDVTAVYRVIAGSACRQTEMKSDARMKLSISEMQMHFLKYVRGGEYLLPKISNNFKKQLFKYRLFEPDFISFIDSKESKLSKYQEFVISHKSCRRMIVLLWKAKRRIMKNSPTIIPSIKTDNSFVSIKNLGR